MKKRMTGILAVMMCAMMILPGAVGESLTLGGTVIPAESVPVYAPIGGTVDSVSVQAGQRVQADDTMYTMKTVKIYADRDGTVSGIFAAPGDDAESVSTQYGAVLYLEGTVRYTVSASTNNAYGSAETKYVHPGENVWMVCRSNTARRGTGIITSVTDNSYQIEVADSNFITGDSVDIYRDATYLATQRIGRGTVNRTSPTAVTATGAIVRIAVEDGTQVRRGDLLLETLEGTFDGYIMGGTAVKAGQAGVVGSVAVQAGEATQKGTAAAVIYPTDRMIAEAVVTEDDCNRIHEGDPVTVEMETDESKVFAGKVLMISSIAEEGTEEVSYRIAVEFAPDDSIRFGMSAVITAGDEDEPEAKAAEKTAEDETAEEKTETEQENSGRGRQGRPEGAPAGGRPQWTEMGNPPAFPGSGAVPEGGTAQGDGE